VSSVRSCTATAAGSWPYFEDTKR